MTEMGARPPEDWARLTEAGEERLRETAVRADYLREPLLAFAGDRKHVDQKTGIARYGPAGLGSPNHPATIRLGYVGTGLSIASAQKLLERDAKGVSGDASEKLQDFPGCTRDRGFFTDLVHSQRLAQAIT